MARLKKGVRYTLAGLAVLTVLLVVAVVVLTRTDFGAERAGRFVVDQLRSSIDGELDVGTITSEGLLRGATLRDVAITGPDGRPFVRADSARLAYRFRTLLGGAVAFDRLILYSPDVVIERLPGNEKWNYELIFPGDTTSAPDTTSDESLVLIEDATIRDGRVTVRLPWEPDGPVEPGDTARLIMEDVPGGRVRTLRFEEVNGRLPRIVWESPEEEGRLIRIRDLAARAYIWETPVELREAEGVVTIRDSLVSFDISRVRLPSSTVELVGRVIIGEENRYDIEARSEDLAFADLQWLYPDLPADGGGSLRFRLQTQESGDLLWLARDARIRTSGTELNGSFGIVTGDTVYFTNVDLEASPLDLDLLRRILPGDLPIEGLLIGTVELEGPISALRSRGDVRYRTYADGAPRESSARWTGTIDARRPWGVRGLDAELRGVDLDQVARVAPGLRLRGTATGRIRADGSFDRGVDVDGDLALDQDGRRTAVRGSGRFAVGGDRSAFDLRFDAEPIPLELLAEQFPALHRLAGEARGPVTVTGSLGDLRVDADLATPAGALRIDGVLALDGPVPRYRAEGEVTDFRLDRLVRSMPETVVTGRFEVDASGSTAEALDGTVGLEVDAARVAGVQVHRGQLDGAVADGLIRVDSLLVSTEAGIARARGSFGFLPGRAGELAVELRADSLGLLEPVVFPEVVPVALGERPEPRLGGRVVAEGHATGSFDDWTVTGRGRIERGLYEDLSVETAEGQVVWTPDSARVELAVDSLRHADRRVPHARATLRYAAGSGDATLLARGVGDQQLELATAFRRVESSTWLGVRQLTLATRDGAWRLADTASVYVGRDGIRVQQLLLLRAPHAARIQVAGVLPWRSGGEATLPADLEIRLDSVRLGELLRVAQTDTVLDGVVTGRFRVAGTALAPVMDGQVVARPFRYGGAVLDSADAEILYRDREIRGRVAGWRGGDAIVTGDGYLPVDLALSSRDRRMLDSPMRVRFRADSVDAALVAFLAPGFTSLSGVVDGELAFVGTPVTPELEGEMRLSRGNAFFEPAAVRYREVEAVARMGKGSVVSVEGRLRTANGRGEVRGTLDLARPSDPVFDLDVVARRLDASGRRDVVAVADGTVHVGGRYTRPIISGDLRLVSGEMNLDEIWRQYQIVQLDPSLYHLFDTTTVTYRPPPDIPFIENLWLRDVTVRAEQDFWLRSQELNVEVAGELDIQVDRVSEDFRLTGALEARRGSYDLQLVAGVPGRRFDIRSGTIEFVGTPGIDPNLNIDAYYRVRRAQGDPIDVVAALTGTLKDPRVNLSSDSDLPLSESDLASYILFGRSGAELTQAQSDVVVASGIGLVRPVVTGGVSSGLQHLATSLGLPFDYIALRAPEYGLGEYSNILQERGALGALNDAQVEVGLDVTRDVFVVGSYRLPDLGLATEAPRNPFGLRVEYRFLPTWTGEFFWEDRFARTPSFGLSEIDDRKVGGLIIFREWGY